MLLLLLRTPSADGDTYIFGDMGVVADEEPSPRVEHVELHPYQAIRVAGEMVQRDALAKVHGLGVKRLPVAGYAALALLRRVCLYGYIGSPPPGTAQLTSQA